MSLTTSCHLCRSRGPFHTLYLGHQREGDSVTFLRCLSCGFIFREPQPTERDLENYYRNLWDKTKENTSFRVKSVATANKFLDQLSRYSRPGRFLDVGCGPGFYLMAARQRGWDTYGVDISTSFEKEEEGFKIFKGVLEEAHFPSCFFDACFMSHTLSHLLNPIQTLREIHRVLGPEGALIVVIPNFLRLGVLSLEGKWDRLLEERHLYLFTPETAQRMIRTSGFKLLRLDAHAEFFTHDQFKKLHISLDKKPARLITHLVSKPKEFLRRLLGKIFPGPALVLWGKKEKHT